MSIEDHERIEFIKELKSEIFKQLIKKQLMFMKR